MKPKHILFLSSWYPSRLSPFAGDFVQRHAIAASKINEITVLHACKDSSLKERFKIEENITENVKEIIVYYRNTSFKPLNFLRRFIALNKGYNRIKNINIIHLNVTYPAGLYALYLKFIRKKPYVITEHWTGFREESFQKINTLEKFFIVKILKNASKLLPVSQDLANSMHKYAEKVPFEVIPNVVFTEYFYPYEKEMNLKPKFLHLSSLKLEHKNIPGILNVIKRLAEENLSFEFHLGGTGDPKYIEDFRKEHQLENIIFTFGKLSYQEVPPKLNQFDGFVLFSNYENQPCVQTESYACGVPFIGTDVGGIKEFFPPNFGYLIEKGNEDQLYDSLKTIIQGKVFASKDKMHAYAKENFAPKVIAQRFDQVYREILNES